MHPSTPCPAAWDRAPERGFAVPVAMAFMVLLTLLGATAAFVVTSDVRVEGLFAGNARAAEAAASGMEHARAVLADSTTTAADWPVTGSLDGYAYRIDVSPDRFDFGSGERQVFFDEEDATGHNGAAGDSVFVINAGASRGRVRATQSLWLTRRSVPRLPAAVSIHARGATEWRAGAIISGLNVSHAGFALDATAPDSTGLCGENRAAINMAHANALAPTVTATLDGDPGTAGSAPPYVTYESSADAVGPEDVLRVPAGALDPFRRSGYIHGLSPPDTLSGVTWIDDEAASAGRCLTSGGCGDIAGSGVLIVHNPRFDPRQHDPSDPQFDAGIAANPAFGPAVLHDLSGGIFRGIVIVDQLPETTSGSFRVQGAIVELSRRAGTVRFDWPGARVDYSCPSIIDAARAAGSGPRLLAWKG